MPVPVTSSLMAVVKTHQAPLRHCSSLDVFLSYRTAANLDSDTTNTKPLMTVCHQEILDVEYILAEARNLTVKHLWTGNSLYALVALEPI